MDSDEEDFVLVGTPIEREEEVASRKKKALAEASGHLRSLPPWKQEVRDEDGRRRFHGSFTGGFSAGYYNTVGSKEGWTPQSFTSSRKNRAEIKQQSILNFLDQDEKAEMEGHLFGTSSQFDTFGFTAAGLARKKAEMEQMQRPSAIPGPVPDELVLPATESIGVKLLLKMGWRRGRQIKDSHTNSLYDVRREARKAFLALSSDDTTPHVEGRAVVNDEHDGLTEKPIDNVVQPSHCTPVYVRHPKQDLYGLGYDPFKHAPEFWEKKRSRLADDRDVVNREPFRMKENLFSSNSGRVAPGFGIGALEEFDIDDEDVYASEIDYKKTYDEVDEEDSRLVMDIKQTTEVRKKLNGQQEGAIPVFRVASSSDYQLERFDPPVIPKDFVPHHKFSAPLDINNQIADHPPHVVLPPEDNNVKVMIEGFATLVARSGKLFEDLSREKNYSNPLFSFLTGGSGHDYYARKLWEERQKRIDQTKSISIEELFSRPQKMTAESRGKILGEKTLERLSKDSDSSVASTYVNIHGNLSDAFTRSESSLNLLKTAKPFKDDPTKQERFEQFLKDKYQGGLRSIEYVGADSMSETARARERLDFEAAAESIEKAKLPNQGRVSPEQLMDFTMAAGLKFASAGVGGEVNKTEDAVANKMYPRREEFQWHPAAVLCKRFDVNDPYMGKPPPTLRARSKMDSLIFTSDSASSSKLEEMLTARDRSPVPQTNSQEMATDKTSRGDEDALEVKNIERPVDLYKAIFSDDSDDEGQSSSVNLVDDPQKKIEAANTILSRLIAGDFLQSLGAELGLEVPPDLSITTHKTRTSASGKSVNAKGGISNHTHLEDTPAAFTAINGSSDDKGVSRSMAFSQVITNEAPKSDGKIIGTVSAQKDTGNAAPEKMSRKDRKAESSSLLHDVLSNSLSSEDGRSDKQCSRRGHHRRCDTDSSEDYGDQHRSHSRDRKKWSSQGESSGRKHSKHKRVRGDSPVRHSHHGRQRDPSETTSKKRRQKE